MKQCFGYVRVSTLKQGEGVSLEAQRDAILRFAGKNDITITRWFEEQQTAAKSGRPVFDAMLKDLWAGKAAGVVMHKIDRSARNFFDWARIGDLADRGIDVHFATESFDFRSRGGRLTANIQMAVAEDYVRNLRSEIKKGQRGLLERGYYPFSAPIGYSNNGKGELKTIDPISGPLVRQAFELYASGQYSLHSLRHELARRGLRGASGGPLSKGCLERFLANPFYTGTIRIRRAGEVYAGGHEPLIDAELFERVALVRSGKSGKKVTRHNHLFRGLFACGSCGRAMIPERQKGYVYYRCHVPACPRNCIREEPLDSAVRQVLQAVRLSDASITAIDHLAKEWARAGARSYDAKTASMRLAKVNERIEKLEDAAIEQIIDKATFMARKEKLLLEKTAIEQEAADQDRFGRDKDAIGRLLELLKNLAMHYDYADPVGKREIIEIGTSNRSVMAKNVSVEPANWLVRAEEAVTGLSGADARTTSRIWRLSKRSEWRIRELAALARSSEVGRLHQRFMDGYKNAAGIRLHDPIDNNAL